MIAQPLKPQKRYDHPRSEVIHMKMSSILCSSPGAGENEEIGFEDWGINSNVNMF